MNVHGVGQGQGIPPQVQGGRGKPEAQGVEASGTTQATEKQPGVIRLLQEGHFRGVADARLRINFADELSALGQSNAAAAVGDEITAVLEAVDTVAAEFLATPDLSEEISGGFVEIQATFEIEVTGFVKVFSDTGGGDTAQLIADIQGAFDDFIAAITTLLADHVETPAAEGGGTEGPPAVEVSTEVASAVEATAGESEPVQLPQDFQDVLDSLRAAFADSLVAFESALEGASSVLPELSEPNGNGVAFDKFVDILNGLQDASTAPEGSAPNDGVNLEA